MTETHTCIHTFQDSFHDYFNMLRNTWLGSHALCEQGLQSEEEGGGGGEGVGEEVEEFRLAEEGQRLVEDSEDGRALHNHRHPRRDMVVSAEGKGQKDNECFPLLDSYGTTYYDCIYMYCILIYIRGIHRVCIIIYIILEVYTESV